ncbi:hypothetical protein GCM10022221_13430 [Actinocorallia aurea]
MRAGRSSRRNIYFFRLDAGSGDDGLPLLADLSSALKKLEDLPFRSVRDGGRYLHHYGLELCAWIDQIEPVARVRFASIRREALPQAETGGDLRDLGLPEGSGLVEISHICVFMEDNIAGIEYNFHAPRPVRFQHYLKELARKECPDFRFEALLKQDVADDLREGRAIRKLNLSVRESFIDTLAAADQSLGEAFRAAARFSQADYIGLILEPTPYQRSSLAKPITSVLRTLVGLPDWRDNARRARATITNTDGTHADEVDLLKDELISQKKILRASSSSRVLEHGDAYAKIEEAYGELREKLLAASSISIDSSARESRDGSD